MNCGENKLGEVGAETEAPTMRPAAATLGQLPLEHLLRTLRNLDLILKKWKARVIFEVGTYISESSGDQLWGSGRSLSLLWHPAEGLQRLPGIGKHRSWKLSLLSYGG